MVSLVIHFPSRSLHFFLFRSKFRKSCVHVQTLCALLVGTFHSLRFFLLRKQWVQSGFKQFQSGLWKVFSTKDSVFSCYARFISTEFGITRILQREHRSYQKKQNGTCIITIHDVRFDIFMVIRWFQRVEVFRTEVSGNGAWEWFQTVSDPLE